MLKELILFHIYFVLKSLEKVGLSEGDVQFVDVPVQNVTSALQKGQIFAGHTYEPFISDAVKKGFKILFTACRYSRHYNKCTGISFRYSTAKTSGYSKYCKING